MNPRVFFLEEAEAMIPQLEKLVGGLKEKKKLMQKMHDELLVLDLIAGPKSHDYKSKEGREYIDKSSELESLIFSFEEEIMAVNKLGCFLKDMEKGIVDFFHVRGKELVYLCWNIGETRITHYRDLDGGDKKRKPI